MQNLNSRKVINYLIGAYCVYALLYIWKTSFVIDGERFFVLFDDAMVSMRYAKNFAAGHGLVWNLGEMIEGFTNPLWTFLMAFLHNFGLPASKISLVIQLIGILCGILTLRLVSSIVSVLEQRDTVDSKDTDSLSLMQITAVTLTGFYLPLNTWILQGMEVAILTPLICYCMLLGIRFLHQSPRKNLTRSIVWALCLLGLSIFIRMDMVVPFLSFAGFLALVTFYENKGNAGLHNNRAGWQIILLTAVLVFGLVGLQTAFRYWYYGDILPNTFYLKATGIPMVLRLSTGVFITAKFITNMGLVIALIPLALVIIKRRKEYLFLLVLVIGQLFYSIYVGGDAWDWWGGSNRYISIAMPLFFVLVSLAIVRVFIILAKHIQAQSPNFATTAISSSRYYNLGYIAIVLSLLFSVNMIYGIKTISELLLQSPAISVPINVENVKMAHSLAKITTPRARIAVVLAGVIPYFLDRTYIDILGKNDSYIAHLPVRQVYGPGRYTDYHPGHRKWDYSYSIGKLKPDVVAQLWIHTEEAEPYLKEYKKVTLNGQTMYLRTDSHEIDWQSVDSLQALK